MIQVPSWWLWVSGIYFIISMIWTAALIYGALQVYRRALPILVEARGQVRRVGDQAKEIGTKTVAVTAALQTQTHQLLGTAESAGNEMTRRARTVGTALTGLMVATRVIGFVRKIL